MIQYELRHPDLLQVLGTVGHGDRIAVVDGNYPTNARRAPHVKLISLNVTHGLVDALTLLRLIGSSVPIESMSYPQPSDEVRDGKVRQIHQEFVKVQERMFPDAVVEVLSPADFYEATTDPHLAVMVASGEARHFGSAVLTVGFLPDIDPRYTVDGPGASEARA
jgi:L-fucose mutarotase